MKKPAKRTGGDFNPRRFGFLPGKVSTPHPFQNTSSGCATFSPSDAEKESEAEREAGFHGTMICAGSLGRLSPAAFTLLTRTFTVAPEGRAVRVKSLSFTWSTYT